MQETLYCSYELTIALHNLKIIIVKSDFYEVLELDTRSKLHILCGNLSNKSI